MFILCVEEFDPFSSVQGKLLLPFQSKNTVFDFIPHGVKGAYFTKNTEMKLYIMVFS